MQQLDYILVFYPVEDPRAVAATAQDAFVLHHVKLLTFATKLKNGSTLKRKSAATS